MNHQIDGALYAFKDPVKRSGVVRMGMTEYDGFYFFELDAQQRHIVGNTDLAVPRVKKDRMAFCSLVYRDEQ